jgi:hypothetical protein
MRSCALLFYLFTFLPLFFFVPLHPNNQIIVTKWTTTRRIIIIRKAGGTAGKTANPLAAKTVFKKGLAQ